MARLDIQLSMKEMPNEQRLLEICRREYPLLAMVDLHRAPPSAEWNYTGGSFIDPKFPGEKPAILIGNLDEEGFAYMKKVRSQSLRMTAALLGVAYENLSLVVVRTFIVLHEIGHALDFLSRFVGASPSTATLVRASRFWRKESGRQPGSLPIPGVDPTLLEVKAKDGTLQQILDCDEKIQGRLRKRGIVSIETLRTMTNAEYRTLPQERTADLFAASMMCQLGLLSPQTKTDGAAGED